MIKKLSASVLASVAILLATAVSGVIFARLLGPSGRGVLAAVTLWPAVIAGIGSLGVVDAASYFTANGQIPPRVVLGSSAAVLGLLATGLIGFGIPLIGVVLGSYGPDAVWLGRLGLVGIPLTLFSTAFAGALLGTSRTGLFNMIRSVQSVVVMLGALALLAMGVRSVRAFVGLAILGQILSCAGAFLACMLVIGPRWVAQTSVVRTLLAYGVKLHVGYIASVLNLQLSQMLMSMLLAPTALGLYTVGVSLAGVVLIVPTAVVISTFPRLAAEDSSEALELLGRAVRAALAFSLVLAIPMTLGASGLISLLFGEAYLPATGVTRILLIAAVPLGISVVLSTGFQALNCPLVASHAQIVGLVVTVALMPVLLWRFGPVGAAVVSLLAYSIAMLYMLSMMQRRFRYGTAALMRPRRTDWAWVVAQWGAASSR